MVTSLTVSHHLRYYKVDSKNYVIIQIYPEFTSQQLILFRVILKRIDQGCALESVAQFDVLFPKHLKLTGVTVVPNIATAITNDKGWPLYASHKEHTY